MTATETPTSQALEKADNDVAVATRVLQQDNHARRIAIVDLDVHQGDGTAAIFAGHCT